MNTALSDEVNNVYPAQSVLVDNSSPVFDQATGQYIHSRIVRFVTDEYIRDVKNNRRTIEDFYKGLSKVEENDAKSLLYTKNYYQGRGWENISFDSDDYRNQLILHLRSCDNPLEEFNNLIRHKIDNTLPETYLDWFKNDLRCTLFLAHLINHLLVHEAYKGKKELIEAVSDFLRFNIYMFNHECSKNLSKYSVLYNRVGDWRTVQVLYVKSIYLKNRTKKYDWIDPKNDEMIDWIYDYLSREGHEHIILDKIFIPENTQEKYELILASLDVLSNVEDPSVGTKNKKGFSLRSYVLSSMKKAWDGQKSYEAKNKVDEWKVKVYKKNHAKLKALIAFSDFTDNQMINNSIEQMYDQLIKEDINDQ